MKKTLSKFILNLSGWKVEGTSLEHKKCIIIGAPHTSNWDFPIAILGMSALNIKATWVAKQSIFKGPFKHFFSLLSGMPVNRNFSSSFFLKTSFLFKNHKNAKLALMPEGTRAKKDHWKFGFYYIALKEDIPIALGYIDYGKKIIGIGQVIYPTNINSDIKTIQNFYLNKKGKYPKHESEIKIRDNDYIKINKLKRLLKHNC